jgi:nickel superoxide dismutase
MSVAARLLKLADRVREPRTVHAHCDIPCGVYDPEQARIEAESCLQIINKYHASDDPIFRDRCVQVKEERADLAKHHLYVLWSDYFKPPHVEQFPNLHDTFWQAAKQASKVKHTVDADEAQKLLDMIDEIDEMWKKTGGLDNTRVSGRPGN